MREDICSIPVNDVFAPKCGCPICRMEDLLEARLAEYITGAAMMEPDVRVETNRLGFCTRHFEMIRACGGRLSVALILQTRLKEVETQRFSGKQSGKGLPHETCFICEKLNANMEHLLESTAKLWERDPDFRALFSQQECLCLPHRELCLRAAEHLPKKLRPVFTAAADKLAGDYLLGLEEDVTHFCSMFDYRNAGQDWGGSKDSIERAIAFLTGDIVGLPAAEPGGTDEKSTAL